MDPEAYSWFQSVDADHSGYISLKELKQALVNSNWSSFNDETCLMMISEFHTVPQACRLERGQHCLTVGRSAHVLSLKRPLAKEGAGFKTHSP